MVTLIARLMLAATVAAAPPALADWRLDGDASRLSFITIKAGDVAEVNTFGELSGSVGGDGHARVVIQLASVNTLIPIRDQRMREVLFRTKLFPTASATTRLDLEQVQEMAPGATQAMTTEVVLHINEREIPISAELLVARLAERRMLVTTLKPLVVGADAAGLTEGVEKLREIAGLPAISKAVPVTFVLQFERD